jgi:hypothetical protein
VNITGLFTYKPEQVEAKIKGPSEGGPSFTTLPRSQPVLPDLKRLLQL